MAVLFIHNKYQIVKIREDDSLYYLLIQISGLDILRQINADYATVDTLFPEHLWWFEQTSGFLAREPLVYSIRSKNFNCLR